MNSSFSKTLPFALSLLLIFAACDSDDDEPDPPESFFASVDANNNGVVDYEEYMPILNRIRYRENLNQNFLTFFDADESGDFSEEELGDLVRLTFDPGDDGIRESEFEAGADFFLDGDQEFGDYDTDEDTIIQESEFVDSFDVTTLFGDFDTSGDGEVLSRSELERGVFGLIDRDDDGVLSEEELNNGVSFLFPDIELPQQ